MLTLSKALKNGQIREFIAQEEGPWGAITYCAIYATSDEEGGMRFAIPPYVLSALPSFIEVKPSFLQRQR